MLSISKAQEKDYQSIVDIGSVSVPKAHGRSCTPEDLKEYTTTNYNETAIKKELRDDNNIYHILKYEGKAFGFSKIILNAKHPNIDAENVAKSSLVKV